jgi:ketosteroid isomerase-like protein
MGNTPVLYVVACGGPPAAGLGPFVTGCREDGWDVCVVATPSALKFLDAADLARRTGRVVRSEYKRPEEPDLFPPADAMVVAPATFNTVNKLAHGSSDTLALGLLNEAVGLRLPMVVVPTPSRGLALHPVFAESVARLRSWGVRVLFPVPADAEVTTVFPWRPLADETHRIRTALGGPADREGRIADLYEAFNRRDVAALLASLAPDVVWPNRLDGGTVRGHDAVRAYWERQWARVGPTVRPVGFVAEPDGQVTVAVHQVVSDATGATVADKMVTHAFRFAGDLVAEMRIRE